MQNFTDEYYPNASHLVTYLHAYYMKYRLRVRLNNEVTKVERDTDGTFHITTQRGTAYTCKYLIWGVGLEFHDPWGTWKGNGTSRVIKYSELDRRQIRQTFYVWSSNACEHRRTKWHEEKRQHVQQKQAGK